MDTLKLVATIESEIKKEGRFPEEKIFLKLLKKVWQVDWTIPPSDVWFHMIQGDTDYFRRFMGAYEEHEEAEEQLIREWEELRTQLPPSIRTGGKKRFFTLITDINNWRHSASQDV
jgi:hypothetical protein